ncbi:hypothetical protein [Pontibacter amylolyticus]|uniref:hypothetical protein n=1 Tax=Pontibacter amylolyticus TaxID=1424080 RepID=UPI0027E44673|nr:hypothetical protein [Pontibacter amylolyticus]
MRYFFHIGYSGTHYKGWQRHPYGVGVQQVIEDCLKKILKQPVAIVGCGRTDAGVHASQFFPLARVCSSCLFFSTQLYLQHE